MHSDCRCDIFVILLGFSVTLKKIYVSLGLFPGTGRTYFGIYNFFSPVMYGGVIASAKA
jgi:hypothetical protein